MDLKEIKIALYEALKEQAELKVKFYRTITTDIIKNRTYLNGYSELAIVYQNERDLAMKELEFYENKIDSLK